MHHRISATIVIALSFMSFFQEVNAHGIELFFSRYNVSDGLVSNEINEIYQDSHGFIWSATNNGLVRFDGYEFVDFRSSYDRPDYFLSNTILDIEESGNEIWIATPIGVDIFDKTDASVIHLDGEMLSGVPVKCMLSKSDNEVFIGGEKGLYIYSKDKGTVNGPLFPDMSYVRKLYKDSFGNIWIGTWQNGVYFWRSGSNAVEKIEYGGLPGDVSVTDFIEKGDGNVYISTWGDGLFCLEQFYAGNRHVNCYSVPKLDYSHLDWNIIYDMDFDTSGNLWAGSPGGLKILSPTDGGFAEVPYNGAAGSDQLQFHEVWCVFRGKDGTMWLSDYGNGLVSARPLDSDIQEVKVRKSDDVSGAVTAIYRSSEEVFMFGVRGAGVVVYDFARHCNIEYPVFRGIDSESNAVVSFVEVPESRSLFLAMRYFGVYRVRLDNGTPVSLEHFSMGMPDVRNDFTNTAISDRLGNIWVGTKSGVVLIRRSHGDSYIVEEPDAVNRYIRNSRVEAMMCDRKGNIWIGSTESGLFRVSLSDGCTSIVDSMSYSVADGGLSNDRISTLFEDSSGRIWVGTVGGGLSLYDREEDRFHVIDDMYLFPSDVISSITEDRKGNLWISTSNGFLCYNPDDRIDVVRYFGAGRGLENLSFISNSVWTDGDEVVFGGYDGITMFRLDALKDMSGILPPCIIDMQVFSKSVFGGMGNDWASVVDKLPPYTSSVVLRYKDKSISFKFSSPVYDNDNSLIRYAYRLEGLDNEWNYVGADRRVVTYSNLRPGRYVFKVQAANENGEWIQMQSEVSVLVKPSPWASWWAKLIYAMLSAVLGVVMYITARNRIRLRQELRIEQMERLKSEEVNNAKLMFFTNVSHELFTPITVMSCSLEKLLEKEDGDSALHRILRSNLNRLLRLLQQILEFRKAESSNLRLKVSRKDIVQFVHKLCEENFSPLVNDRNIRLIFSSSEEHMDAYFDSDKLDKILYNLLSNAYKYNRQDGKVFVRMGRTHTVDGTDAVEISVKDTGFGISKQRQSDLFKRFYEGDYRKFNTRGTGIGLSLTKDLVTLHKGTIEVESVEGEGTVFRVVLPVVREAYSDDQIEDEMRPDKGIVYDSVNAAECKGGTDIYEETGLDGASGTLLVVEDNTDLLFVMKTVLEPEYKVFTALNGKEAIPILEAENVDLVITDYMMPEMDGVELCRHIRTSFDLSHLPVIMLSARSAIDSRLKSFEAGVDAYVSKPFDVKTLLAQINGMIANRKNMYEKFRSGQSVEPDLLINTDMDQQFVDKVIRIIEEHISDPDFGIDSFNKAMNMSTSTLYRKIKGVTGMAPKEFIRNIRFKYACRLLSQKTTSVADVAYMVGFTDAKYFCQSFKKEFGMTPSQYMSQNAR